MSDYSSILFARPSFLEGVGRILDFTNLLNEYNRSLTPEQADELGLRADWHAIGEDMRLAIKQHAGGEEHGEQTKKAR
jgi:hypothetical protein